MLGGSGGLLLLGGAAAGLYFLASRAGAPVRFGSVVWGNLAGPFLDPTGGLDFYTIGVSGEVQNNTSAPVSVVVVLSTYSLSAPITLRTGNSGDILIPERARAGFAANLVILQTDTRGLWVRRIVLIESGSGQDFQAVNGPNFNF